MTGTGFHQQRSLEGSRLPLARMLIGTLAALNVTSVVLTLLG